MAGWLSLAPDGASAVMRHSLAHESQSELVELARGCLLDFSKFERLMTRFGCLLEKERKTCKTGSKHCLLDATLIGDCLLDLFERS